MPRKTERVFKFTKTSIDKLPLPQSGRVEWWDEDVPQLCLRVSSTGTKTFAWFGHEGRTLKRVTIGSYPETAVARARAEAKSLSGNAAIGQPVRTRRAVASQEWTLGELWTWYFETHSKPHKRTWEKDESRYTMRLKRWEKRKVSTIEKSEVQALHLEINKKVEGTGRQTGGPYAANKMLELLGHMFRLGAAINPERVPCPDPTFRIKRFPRTERERILDEQELPRFLKALESLPRETTRDAIEMCLWTGARRSNVFSMRWDELSLTSKVWIIPKEKFKSKKPLNVPLLDPALEILARRKQHATGEWVFPGRGANGHFSCPRNAIARVLKNARLTNVRIHDLRRTLGSRVSLVAPNTVVQKMLGHESISSTRVYTRIATHSVAAAMKTAIETMQGKVQSNERSEDSQASN